MISSLLRLFGKTNQKLLDFILPPQCINCHVPVFQQGGLCASCWEKISFISKPHCISCGFPFNIQIENENICGPCARKKPLVAKARAAIYYNEASKPLILRFKHGDALHIAPLFAEWLYQAGHELFQQAEYLAPIPLHWSRLIYRGYNQAALLSQKLSKKVKISHLPDLLERKRRTPSQGNLTPKEREKNVFNAFKLNKKYKQLIHNKHILLIDDVLTSGATARACAMVLKKSGAKQVDILTLARVIKLEV
jgi:ComF family protein